MATGYATSISKNDSGIRSSLEGLQESEPFSTIIQTTELPVVVKYDSSNPLDEGLVTPAFDSRQPLLIRSKHMARRMRARCVQFQAESKTFLDCDCDAIIPEGYPGWFAVFGNPSTLTRDPIVPHYRRVSQLAISTCTKFLVAGDRPANVLLAKQGEEEQVDFHPATIYPGTVLQKGKLFSLLSHYTKVKKGFRKKVKKKVREVKYMSAHDGDGHTLFIPCDMEGLFYVLETQTAHLSVPVIRFQDIIQRYKFPVLIKLVHGQIPSCPSFNGTLVLLESQLTSFAMTFSLRYHTEMIFEILEDSSLPFILSAPEEHESEEYSNALHHHKGYEDFFLQNIRFQYRTSDYIYVRNSEGNKDFTDIPEEKHSSRGLEICCVRIEKLHFFPPSPITSNVVDDDKVPQSVLSLNLKEIKRTVTFERPLGIRFDTIPIERRAGDSRRVNSTDEERHVSDTNSSASQPSLQDLVISGSEEGEEDLPLPPPTPELLQSESVEDEEVPAEVPDESYSYYGMWTADTLNRGSKLSVEAGEGEGITFRNKTDNKNGHGNGSPNRILEDENGYVIASELTLPLDSERNRRPASYVSIHPLENDYETLPDRPSGQSENKDNPSISGETRGRILALDSRISSGSHYYTRLQKPFSEEVDKSKPTYVNIPFSETGTLNGAGCHDKIIYHVPRNLEDQTVPPTQNGQSAITQELASRSWKEVLRQTSNPSPDKISGYMNLQDITQRDDIAASHKDRLLDQVKQQDLKMSTQEALMALNEEDFASIVQADDPLDKLKEFIPQISKSDVFKIGLCLKDV